MSSAAAVERDPLAVTMRPARSTQRTLLLGMGNPILCDDGIGILLAQRIGARLGPVDGLSVEEECTVGGLNLLDLVAGFDRLIVLDSIKTRGGRPGEWYRFDGSALRETMNLSNVHDANFATALELGRRVGLHLPVDGDIHVFAVEVLENLTFGSQLTPELETALPDLVEEMCVDVEGLLKEDG